MVSAISFGNVAVRGIEIPLSAGGAGVVARCRRRVHSKLCHQPGAYVRIMEVTANSHLRELNFIGTKDLTRSAYGVVLWMVEIVDVVDIDSHFGGEGFGVQWRLLGARIAGQPGEVAERKRLCFLGLGLVRRNSRRLGSRRAHRKCRLCGRGSRLFNWAWCSRGILGHQDLELREPLLESLDFRE